jgi:Fe-S-cluster containining protein
MSAEANPVMLDGEVEIYRNRQWVVSNKGITSITGVNGSYEYWIEKERLKRPHWLEHMGGKCWVDVEAFIEAYLVACITYGFKIPDIAERIAKAREAFADEMRDKAQCASWCRQHYPGNRFVFTSRQEMEKIELPADFDPMAQQYALGIPCAFLIDKHCSIYAARPIVCHSHLSVSLPKCQMSWKTRKSRNQVGNIPFVLEPTVAGVQLKAGSDLAMAHNGWQLASGELTAMVNLAGQPKAVASTESACSPTTIRRPRNTRCISPVSSK